MNPVNIKIIRQMNDYSFIVIVLFGVFVIRYQFNNDKNPVIIINNIMPNGTICSKTHVQYTEDNSHHSILSDESHVAKLKPVYHHTFKFECRSNHSFYSGQWIIHSDIAHGTDSQVVQKAENELNDKYKNCLVTHALTKTVYNNDTIK